MHHFLVGGVSFRGAWKHWILLLWLCCIGTGGSAGEASDAAESVEAPDAMKPDGESGDDSSKAALSSLNSPEKNGRLMYNFTIDQRMFPKSRDFFRQATGGNAMKRHYKNKYGTDPEEEVGYDPSTLGSAAGVWIPKQFDEEKGKGWGVFLFLTGAEGAAQKKFCPHIVRLTQESLIKNKMIVAWINTLKSDPYGNYDPKTSDLFRMSLALDTLATLRKEFPSLNEPASRARYVVGGTQSITNRVAGALAVNFPTEIKGCLFIGYLMSPRALSKKDFGNRPNRRSFDRDDLPYIAKEADIKKAARSLRVVAIIAGNPGHYIHDVAYHVLIDYRKLGFAVRYFDLPGNSVDTTPPAGIPHEVYDRAFAFLGGDDTVPQDAVRSAPTYVWKWK